MELKCRKCGHLASHTDFENWEVATCPNCGGVAVFSAIIEEPKTEMPSKSKQPIPTWSEFCRSPAKFIHRNGEIKEKFVVKRGGHYLEFTVKSILKPRP